MLSPHRRAWSPTLVDISFATYLHDPHDPHVLGQHFPLQTEQTEKDGITTGTSFNKKKMPRNASAPDDNVQEARSVRSRRKRDVPAKEADESTAPTTPSKRRRIIPRVEPEHEAQLDTDEAGEIQAEALVNNGEVDADELAEAVVVPVSTPRRRGRPPRSSATLAKVNGLLGAASTPKGSQPTTPSKFETPSKINGTDTPSRRTIADRSARRKSARALIDRVVAGSTSDDEAGDDDLVREIYESEEDDDEDEEEGEDAEAAAASGTPSKTPRGRKKGTTTRKKSPTPPRDLPPHEMYFFHNKPGLAKTSNNTLASLDLLTHDEYFSILRGLKDPHEGDIKFLEDLHAESFNQWAFELNEGFSVCLYGYGSKRALLHRFAKYLHSKISDHAAYKIVVVNGYTRALTIREVLTTMSVAVDPKSKLTAAQPVTLLQDVLALLNHAEANITLVLNSADASHLRSRPQFHTLLSQVAAHPRVHLVCGVDTPDFAALWDSGQRSRFNFAFHDATTFASRSAAELEVVDEVHELLGRRARRVGGKDGVAFVLKSLPENAKNLFRLLVGEVLLVAMEQEGDGGGGEENPGVEYRMMYNKAVEEFICSSEMAFRTLLKE